MTNEYSLDADYFIKLCAREFTPDVIRNQRPADLARAFARAARTACADVLSETEFVPAEQTIKWTPLSEEWPPIDEWVLTANPGKEWPDIRANALREGDGRCGRRPGLYYWESEDDFDDVTHWAPMPAMPVVTPAAEQPDAVRELLRRFATVMGDASDYPDTSSERSALAEIAREARTLLGKESA